VSLPQLGIPAIKGKLDTGARTSALHTFFIEPFQKNSEEFVRFGVHPIKRRRTVELICEAPVKDKRQITDSGGHTELRYIIETSLQCGREIWPIELSLTNRESMLFRCLLGRTALQGRFMVDPARSFVLGRALRRAYREDRDIG
jgi:hypothetical protein